MITVRRIMKMDQGWAVPSIIGVEINKNIRQDSMITFVSWSVDRLVGLIG